MTDIGRALSNTLNMPIDRLWSMSNGYALCTEAGLAAIQAHLDSLDKGQLDVLRGLLRIGLHHHVEVTDASVTPRPFVSQAYCSALPVAYSSVPAKKWTAFARLILDAAYEATLLAAVLNAQHGGSNIVALTHLGGGVFGNDPSWIDQAIQRSLRIFADHDLHVRVISFR